MLRASQVITLFLGFAIFSNHSVLSGTKEANHSPSNKEIKKKTVWDDLDMEYLGKDLIYYSLDGRPKLRVKVTNIGNETISGIRMDFRADEAMSLLPGCATFPNGGTINLEPGESTIVSAWSNCYFGNGLNLPPGTSEHVGHFMFSSESLDSEITFDVNFSIVNDFTGGQPDFPEGDMVITGTVSYPQGYARQSRVALRTPWGREQLLEIDGETGVFTTSVLERDDWMIVVETNAGDQQGENLFFPTQVVYVSDFDDPTAIEIEMLAADHSYMFDFGLSSTVTTPTGFWRGAVSKSEQTVAFFPGQENWMEGNGKTVDEHKAASTIYKYAFDGTKLWEKAVGWETWGGDMSPDGSKVLYLIEPNGPFWGVGILNGEDGSVIWEHQFERFAPGSRYVEGLEVAMSNDASMAAVGSNPTGVVSILDADQGTIMDQIPNAPDDPNGENWGQVRKVIFSPDDQYIYVGSGDNYLRKVRLSDKQLMWKAFIGGWPFVNGFEFSSDGSFIVTGTKSFDQTRVNVETGEVEWQFESQTLEIALAQDNTLAVSFGGIIMDAATGKATGFTDIGAESRFLKNSQIIANMDRNVTFTHRSGKRLFASEESGGGTGGGEQSQWSYISEDGQYAIIAYRDMVTSPGNQVGIAFYQGTITESAVDVNDLPTDISLSASSLDENNTEGQAIGDLSTEDPDTNDSHSYDFIAGTGDTDNALFSIEGSELRAAVSLNFEEKPSYSVRIVSTDVAGAGYEKTFTITVNDINDAPEVLELDNDTADENQESGISIGSLTATDDDPNDTHTYSLVAGTGDTDNASFTLEGAELKAAVAFNYEDKNAYSILVRADDGNGGVLDTQFTINVSDVNETPTDLLLSNSTVAEGQESGVEVGTLSATDEDTNDSYTYELVAGDGDTGNGSFNIDNNKLLTGTSFTFSTQSTYLVRVKVTDSGNETFEKQFTIEIEEQIVTGIEDDPGIITSIYPNPATDFVQVNLISEAYPFDVKMYDMSGNLKTSEDSIFDNSIRLDIRNMPKALYILVVKDKNGRITRKKLIISGE